MKVYWVLTKRTCPVCKEVFRSWLRSKKHTLLCGAKYIDEEYTAFPKEEI